MGTGFGRSRRTSGLWGTNFTAGSSICPARCSVSNRPRQTISRNAPLACFHCQTSHNFCDSLRRLARGWAAISSWI